MDNTQPITDKSLTQEFVVSPVEAESPDMLNTILAEAKTRLNHDNALNILKALQDAAESHNQRPLVAQILQQDRFIYDLAWATGKTKEIRDMVLQMDKKQVNEILKADNALLGMVWNSNGLGNAEESILDAVAKIDTALYTDVKNQLEEFKTSSDKKEYEALEADIWLGK